MQTAQPTPDNAPESNPRHKAALEASHAALHQTPPDEPQNPFEKLKAIEQRADLSMMIFGMTMFHEGLKHITLGKTLLFSLSPETLGNPELDKSRIDDALETLKNQLQVIDAIAEKWDAWLRDQIASRAPKSPAAPNTAQPEGAEGGAA